MRDGHPAVITGKGVDVAVIDTGIAPVPGVANHVDGADLSSDSQPPERAHNGAYGHGTAMRRHDRGRRHRRCPRYAPPDTRLIDFNVGASNGAVDVSQLIAAIDWGVQHRDSGDLHVKVHNLSVGTYTRMRAAEDPLAKAVDGWVVASVDSAFWPDAITGGTLVPPQLVI